MYSRGCILLDCFLFALLPILEKIIALRSASPESFPQVEGRADTPEHRCCTGQ